jgi:hypothetical protein
VAHPITGALSTAVLAYARPTEIVVHDLSANLTVAVGYQLADEDDELSWGAATLLSAAWVTATGSTFDTAFTDLSALTQRKLRFVLLVKNTTGSAIETGHVSAKIDVREA